MTTSYDASPPTDATSQPPPAPWMPLEPLTELWAAFSKEATSREALLAASEAFAALTAEREAIQNLNWLPSAWLRPLPQERMTPDMTPLSLFVAQQAIIEALSRAASHWYEAVLALVEQKGLSPSNERDALAESSELDLETLIGYTLSQRVRVWAIAHSVLVEQMQRLFPAHEQGGAAQ